uniref:Uncharacterized protein n=1 Tax=Anguilla anguilla TaxID=7936 RepID=A0A0E9R237_ANGAN
MCVLSHTEEIKTFLSSLFTIYLARQGCHQWFLFGTYSPFLGSLACISPSSPWYFTYCSIQLSNEAWGYINICPLRIP